MTRPATRTRLPHVVALLAVALLTLAGIRSIVMQAATAAPGGMAECGMAMDGARHGHGADPAKGGDACAFCAAVAHAPLAATVAALAPPRALVWTPPAPRIALGPRGPPTVVPKARGPPDLFLT